MEKRGKQNRIMMRPQPVNSRPNPTAMKSLTSLHRRASSTMQPIVVAPTIETPIRVKTNTSPEITMAKPLPMGIPAFKPLPPKDDTLSVVPLPTTKRTYTPLQIPQAKGPGLAYQNPVPKHVNDIANQLYPAYNTKKVDDYNSITGYGDDSAVKINKEDINEKIAEIAKAGNISMEAVEAAIALRQQQLLNKYASIPMPKSTTSTTTTTEAPEVPVVSEPEAEPVFAPNPPRKRHQIPTSGKVMNAPKEYYPVGYEKNFDDHFQSKVDLPGTNFHCGDQKYFPGLYGDENLGCMVFHVCALTDDGLVMKSFLCPESTLFDQTILKCNWWFYVDCKSTRKLYETNIPVSKSYQLMKALTFFSSYKKENQDDGGRGTNPEDIEGIKEAITILENHDGVKSTNKPSVPEIITAQSLDPRNSNVYKMNATSEVSGPVYNHRTNRNYRNETMPPRKNTTLNDSVLNSSEMKPLIVKSDASQSSGTSTSLENSSKERNNRVKFANRQTKRQRVTAGRPFSVSDSAKSRKTVNNRLPASATTESNNINSTVKSPTTTIAPKIETPTILTTTTVSNAKNGDSIIAVKQEKLEDPTDTPEKILADIQREAEKSPAIRRFYRSSSEISHSGETVIVNNEKVQIVRPKSFAKFVGEYPTPTAVIEKLDEAILGISSSSKKDSTLTIIKPQHARDSLEHPTQKT